MKSALPVLAVFAFAACGFVCRAQADESCLVGTWQAEGNGAAEWMQRNMPPGMNINVPAQRGFFRFDADGSYQAGTSLRATTTLQDGGQAATEGPASAHSSGTWQVTDGQLVLTPNSEGITGAMTVTLPDGQRTTKPLPAVMGGPMSFGVDCAGDTLTTRKSFPGIADPLTQRYQRQTD